MNSNKVTTIIERIKWHSRGLNDMERELLRDELLAILFIKDSNIYNTSDHSIEQSIKGLSEEEKMLIKKLASQTEMLSRLKKNNGQGEA